MGKLHPAEIERIKAARIDALRSCRPKPTVDPGPFIDNPFPGRGNIGVMASRCFNGTMTSADLRYMALALLQMQDEVCELRERVRQIETANPRPSE